jgi:CheY-like chemotaxis protein
MMVLTRKFAECFYPLLFCVHAQVMDGFEMVRRYRAHEAALAVSAARRLASDIYDGDGNDGDCNHGGGSGHADGGGAHGRGDGNHDDCAHGRGVGGDDQPKPVPASQAARAPMPIVGMSANSDLASQSLAVDAGMNAFMPKPFSVADMQAVLDLF